MIGRWSSRVFRSVVALLVSMALCVTGLVAASAANAAIVGWGGRDVTFTPPTLSGAVPVQTVIQLTQGANAGKYMIGGSFTDLGGNPAIDYVARLNANGTVDPTFVPPVLGLPTDDDSIDCSGSDDGSITTQQVRTIVETQVTSGSNQAGDIYIGGNFIDVGGDAKQDFLVRLNANGTLDTGFYPTDNGLAGGTPSYINCVHTMFTGEGSGSTLALIVGPEAYGMGITLVSKKNFDTGANVAGFAPPATNDSAVTGFFCPASACGTDKYVLGGKFTGVEGYSYLVKLDLNGTVCTDCETNTALLDSYVLSVAPAFGEDAFLVGGYFSDKLAKLRPYSFEPKSDFTAPTLTAAGAASTVVFSVAVDSASGQYLFGGSFLTAGGYRACNFVCTSQTTGAVVDSNGRSFFTPPPPNARVESVYVNTYAGDDANVGKYMISGRFTNLGGNAATDYLARLNQSTPSSLTLNSDGGELLDGSDGIRTRYSNGQFQIWRGGDEQLMNTTASPASPAVWNQVAISLRKPGVAYTVGPSSLDLSWQNINFSRGFLFRPWDSVTATGSSTGSGVGESTLTVEVDGLTYRVHLSMDYTYSNNYLRQSFTVEIPAGNTYQVKLFNLYDASTGPAGHGPGFYSDSTKILGTSGSETWQGLRYVSGDPWAGYMTECFCDVVFSNGEYVAPPTGPGFGTDLSNYVGDYPRAGSGLGVNWDFGTSPGTTDPVVVDYMIEENQPPTATPTDTAGELQIAWSDPNGFSETAESYLVTAYSGFNPGPYPEPFTCTATAPTKTCTMSGLDPEVPYEFVVQYVANGQTFFASSPTDAAHAKREVTFQIWGDPTSVGPPVTFSPTLGDAPSTRMAAYTGLTAATGAVPVAIGDCTSTGYPGLEVEATPTGTPGEYKAAIGCVGALADIDAVSVRIDVSAGSCLVAAGLPDGAGSYPVTDAQFDLGAPYGTTLPDGGTTQAYRAIKGGTLSIHNPFLPVGVYFPATRACQPSTAPTTTATATVAGRLTMTVSTPTSNGGSAVFATTDSLNHNGYSRILTKPTNVTGTGGGFRASYFRCGMTNDSPTSISCQLGPPGGVAVTTGGIGRIWNPAACAGQTINFRNRYMTYMGYGLWSDEGTKVLTGGCS